MPLPDAYDAMGKKEGAYINDGFHERQKLFKTKTGKWTEEPVRFYHKGGITRVRVRLP